MVAITVMQLFLSLLGPKIISKSIFILDCDEYSATGESNQYFNNKNYLDHVKKNNFKVIAADLNAVGRMKNILNFFFDTGKSNFNEQIYIILNYECSRSEEIISQVSNFCRLTADSFL